MSVIKTTKTVTEEHKVITGYRCDGCKKEVATEGDPCNTWLSFYAGHRDWSHDSVDSIEHYDVCSPGCLADVIDRILTQEDSRTIYISI